MSDKEKEYEVESITRAKVGKHEGKKTWLYEVKWKDYSVADNTWEPPSSFTGSEHFVDAFWYRVGDERDHTQLKLFREDEMILIRGPPRKLKAKKAPPPSKTAKAQTARQNSQTARQNSQDEIIADSEDEVQIITEASMPSTSIRKRPNSIVGDDAEIPSAKRRRGRPSKTREAEPESISTASRSTRKRPVAVPRVTAVKVRPNAVAKSGRSSTSTKRQRTSNGQALSSASQRLPSREASPDEMPLAPEVVPETVANDAPSEADEAIIAKHAGPDSADPPNDDLFGDSEDVQMQEAAEPVVDKTSELFSTSKRVGRPEPKIPAHRAAKPRVKMMEDVFTTHSGLSVKATLARGPGPSSGPGPSNPRASVRGSRAGPGRSSETFLGSTSLLTARRDGHLVTKRTQEATTSVSRPKQNGVNDVAPEVVSTSHDLPAPDAVEPDLQNAALPTAEEILQLAGMETKVAEALPDYEEASDRDAEGESDHEVAHGEHHHGADIENNTTSVVEPPAVVSGTVTAISDEAAIPEPVTVIPKPLYNPPHGIIGSGSAANENGSAAWRLTTIFGPLGIARDVVRTPLEGPSVETSPPSPALLVVLDSSADIPVFLKDTHLATSPALKSLDVVVSNVSRGPPGKFYKGDTAITLVNAFRTEGSCARIIVDDTANEFQKINFERFGTRLKAGEVFVAMVGTHVLAFCSSENVQLSKQLGMSPNLVGLGDNVLVSEVLIEDDAAYCDAIVNAEDERW